MVRVPRFGRLRIPAGLTQRWRARLRAQRRWWRARWRAYSGTEVLFPEVGAGMVAVDTLARDTGEAAGPRIAILHATAGSGHKRAAQALAAAISELRPGVTVREVDTLVFASRFYRGAYAASYNAMAARAPRLWGVLYHSWELAPVNRGLGTARLALDRLNLRRLVRVCDREAPDAIVCTHFLPVEALSYARGRGRLTVPLYCVITDFTAHPFWAFPHVDRYFVASEQVAAELSGHGVPRPRIEVTGIPIDPRFAHPLGRAEARARFGLDLDRPMVLVMGGGSGVGPLVDVAERLAAGPARPRVVVVCGTNHALRERIDQLSAALSGQIRTLGFTTEIDALMEACDVVVSKAGGLTCSEALVKAAPLVIFRPTPGQEVRNADYLERGGAALHADTIGEVETAVARLLADTAVRTRMRDAATKLAHPDAAEHVARRVLEALPAEVGRSA
jgi:processive 1,2-diacylglycerol beta-glucosyltransferase